MDKKQLEFVTYCIGKLSVLLKLPQKEIYKTSEDIGHFVWLHRTLIRCAAHIQFPISDGRPDIIAHLTAKDTKIEEKFQQTALENKPILITIKLRKGDFSTELCITANTKRGQHPQFWMLLPLYLCGQLMSCYDTSIALVTCSFGSVFGIVMVRMPSSTLAEIWSFTTSSGSV